MHLAISTSPWEVPLQQEVQVPLQPALAQEVKWFLCAGRAASWYFQCWKPPRAQTNTSPREKTPNCDSDSSSLKCETNAFSSINETI